MRPGCESKTIGRAGSGGKTNDAAGFAARESGGLDSDAFERPAHVPSARSVKRESQV